MEEPKPAENQPIQTPAPPPPPPPPAPKAVEEQPPPKPTVEQPPIQAPEPPLPPPPPPPSTATTPPLPAATDPPKSRKRPLDSDVQIQDTRYYKMRLIVKDLRPQILEVLRTPDFQNCKAAQEIQDQINVLMKLCKEMAADDNGVAQKPEGHQQDVKPAEQPKQFQSGNASEKQRPENGETPSTYIVGGSAFGWNFITFSGNEAVYYGRTKESFRSAQTSRPES